MTFEPRHWPTTIVLVVAIVFVAGFANAGNSLRPGEHPPGKDVFQCVGAFGRDTSHAAVVKAFGVNRVARKEIDDETMTVVFPDDPSRRLLVNWRDKSAFRGLASVRIYGRASAWTVAGVRVGASLLDVEQLNGRAFKLNYFEGEYGGDVIDWQGGRFDQPLSGGCRFGANFVIDDTVPTPDMDKEAAADRTLLSGGPGVRAAKPLVAALFVYFP